MSDAAKIRELVRMIDAMFCRPDIAMMFSHFHAADLAELRHFIRNWDDQASFLTDEQKQHCYMQLEEAFSSLTRTIAEYDRERLEIMPTHEMGKA